MNIKLTVSFIGTRYHGFQVQKNAVGITTPIQDAIERVFGERADIKGCSRTDSGVHALGYVLNFKTQKADVSRVALALNSFLPSDIRVINAEIVDDNFHARYDAKSKTYIYRINNSLSYSPFDNAFTLHHPAKLDFEAMSRAAALFIGTKDFAAFQSAGSKISDTVRTVHHASCTKQGNLVVFTITADGFLYNMVRIMVGTLLEVGGKRLFVEQLEQIIQGKTRAHRGCTAAAKGLCLLEVRY